MAKGVLLFLPINKLTLSILPVLLITGCATTARDLPIDYSSVDRRIVLDKSKFNDKETELTCSQLDEKLEILNNSVKSEENVINDNRLKNQVAGYFGGFLLFPLLAMNNNSSEKSNIEKISNEKDEIFKLKALNKCSNPEKYKNSNEVSTTQKKDNFIKDCTGNCFDGQGTLNFSDGSQYIGEFRNGIINGKGKLTLRNGDAYIGKFKNGLVDGKATAIYANGGKYIGEFKNNRMHGNGTLILPNGMKYSGKFKDGVPVIPVKKTLSESDAKNAVLKILKDPDSAKFGRFEQITNTGACLAVNAKNSYGGYTGEQQAFLIKKDAFNWVVIELSEVSYETCIDFFKNRE